MGVKELWSIISTVSEKKSLWELENKIIAIDLSAWICDSQSIYTPQVNMYLRNLFFRTSYLLLQGMKPIFILEGKAPSLKASVIRQRLKNKNPKNTANTEIKVSRSRLSSLQKQCVELLSSLGLQCIQAPGEAEAYCAHLNKLGVVDGVITQDSDVFLYGAREVYRNFHLAPQYSCDSYSMEIIEKKLGLSRIKLVGYSLLVGSDYNNGIQNLGKQAAVKFLLSIPDNEVIQRFVDWRNDSYFKFIEEQKFLKSDNNLEMKIREKCLKDKSFPDLEVVTEYMKEPEEIQFNYNWDKPNLAKFVAIAVKKLTWEEDYAIKKFVPLLARWHLLNPTVASDLKITSIIGVPIGKNSICYRVQWNLYDLITIEPKRFISTAYPEMVEAFEAAKKKKKGPKRKAPLNNGALENPEELNTFEAAGSDIITEEIDEFDLSLVGEDQTRKKRKETRSKKFKKKNIELSDVETNPSQNEEDEFNLSMIIENIVKRPQSNPALSYFS